MFIFQDSSGHNHQIDGPESLHKAMGLPCSQRVVLMTNEVGQFVSAGRTASDLTRNGELVKSLRDGEQFAKAQKQDDKIIQMNRKLNTDKVVNRAKAGEIHRHDRLDSSKIVKAELLRRKKSDVHPLFDQYERVEEPEEQEAEKDDGFKRYDNSPLAKSFRRSSMLGLIDELQKLKDEQAAQSSAYGY
jgi:hypothetical protein